MLASSAASTLAQARELEIARAQVQAQQRSRRAPRPRARNASSSCSGEATASAPCSRFTASPLAAAGASTLSGPRRQQLHLHAGEAVAQRVDLVLVRLPFLVAGVQQQAQRWRVRVRRPARSAAASAISKASRDRKRGHHQRRAFGGAQRQRVAVEQRDELARHGRQQRGFGVDSLRMQTRGAQLRQPGVDARARRPPPPARGPVSAVAFADGEMQVLDFVGDAFFERVRDRPARAWRRSWPARRSRWPALRWRAR